MGFDMALLFMEGFDYLDTAGLSSRFSNVVGGGTTVNVSSSEGRDGGGAMTIAGTVTDFTNFVQRSISAAQTLVVGFRMKGKSPLSTSRRFFSFSDSTAGAQVSLGFSTPGVIVVILGSGQGLLGQIANNTLVADQFIYLELKVTIDNTVGSFELRADGVTVASGSGVTRKSVPTPSPIGLILGTRTIPLAMWFSMISTFSTLPARKTMISSAMCAWMP